MQTLFAKFIAQYAKILKVIKILAKAQTLSFNRGVHKPATLEATWMKRFRFKIVETLTKFGTCKTINIMPSTEMFHNSTINYAFFKRREYFIANMMLNSRNIDRNITEKFQIMSKSLGVDGYLYDGLWFFPDLTDSSSTYRFIIHPRHELPTESSQSHLITKGESVLFTITPQMKTIDESLEGLTPQE
jgi:hypothetical protein